MNHSGKLHLLLLLALILSAALLANPAFYAVDWQNSKNEIRAKALPVYGFIGSTALISADQDKLTGLSAAKNRLTLIDAESAIGNYYLISSNNPNKPLLLPTSIKILFRTENTAVIKGKQDFALLRAADCQIFPLSAKPMILPATNLIAPELSPAAKNPQITAIINQVNPDSILSYIKYLQNMQTRFLQAPNHRAVAEKVRLKFVELGCTEAVLDSFYLPAYTAYTDGVAYPSTWQYNVVATVLGSQNPDEFIVLSGHHDSIVLRPGQDPFVFAPGADDNGSAVAAIWEIFRVMKQQNYQPKKSIKFISFTAEEHGLLGSNDYANKVHADGMKIRAVLNSDLISYNLDSPADWTVRFIPYAAHQDLHRTAANITRQYTTLNVGVGGIENTRSDSYSFVLNGYPAIWYFENPFNPYYHSIEETWDKLDIPYCAEVIKSKCALAVYKNEAPENISGLTVTDQGNGSSLLLKWHGNTDPDLDHYKISLGTATENYTAFFNTNDTLYNLNDLTANQLYYIGVSAVDNDDYESMIVEKSAAPSVVPVAPVNLAAEPLWQSIRLNWQTNTEMDILGYRVYRSNDGLNFVEISTSPVLTDNFTDYNCNPAGYLYYRITAVDNDLHESMPSISSLPVRPVTLDKGIMIIDDTPNGSGTPSSPNDAVSDQFFNSLTVNCPAVANYDILSNNNRVSLSELGPYSTVIWHNQAVELGSAFYLYRSEIKKYLDFGGKLLITADKPGKLIESCNSYPADFPATTFISHYFGADSAGYKAVSRFSGAVPEAAGFNYLEVDSSKALEANGFHIKKIETLHAVSSDLVIYKYDSDYPATVNYGSSKNKPVALLYSGSNFKTALMAVPLYYIKQADARQAVEYILGEKFGETLDIANQDNNFAKNAELLQNYPNPFNPSTKISFTIQKTAAVSLKIFDPNGREIAVLVNAQLASGKYDYRFDGLNLASGVYFYRLETGNAVITKKMVMQK